MQHQATRNARINAKTLRRTMTESERRLWFHLRSEQLGVKFRRQHPLGSYIADFVCLSPKLIVELDGSQHAQHQAYDHKRDGAGKLQSETASSTPKRCALVQRLNAPVSCLKTVARVRSSAS
ncbi:MAG: DUF559 domain-containing protein [Burkholderiales bacterium]|jgi:very-short-patch-repair endonuclease|nr:DUF559 domain-containing protein [Burkholderiales bacterium]